MSELHNDSTVHTGIFPDRQHGTSATTEFKSVDPLAGEFEVDDFDVQATARQFLDRLRERSGTGAEGSPSPVRIVWVLRLLNAMLQDRARDRSQNPSSSREEAPCRRLHYLPVRMGRFTIGQLIGCGGFGEVYRAHDEELHRDVALKILPRRQAKAVDEGDYGLSEARAAAGLNHPYLVPLYEVVETRDFVCLVSELCEGPTLRQYLNDTSEPMNPVWAIEIMRKLAVAVSHAHSRGLIHRDIKPGNVILAPDTGEGELLPFTPRLTDFGLMLDTRVLPDTPEPARLVGTILYMPPEVLLGYSVADARSGDVYSLGLVLYELLCGHLPFKAHTPGEVLDEICLKAPPSLRVGNSRVNRDLQAICFRAIAKQPSDRYESVHALVEDLTRYASGRAVSARRRTWMESGWRSAQLYPQAWSFLTIVLALIIVGTVVLSQKNFRLQQQSFSLENTLAQLSTSQQRAIESQREAIIARDRAEANQREAVGIAYRSDLQMALNAISRSDTASAVSYLGEMEDYLSDSQRQRLDLRLLKTLTYDGWASLPRSDSPVEEVVLFPSQRWFAVAAADNRVRIYRTEDAALVHEIELSPAAQIHALAVSADESQMAVGASHPAWFSWLKINGNIVSVFPLDISSLSSPDRVATQREHDAPLRLSGFSATVDSLAFHPDGKRLAIGQRYEPVEIRWLDGSAPTQRLDSEKRNEDLFFSDSGELIWLARKTGFSRQPADLHRAEVRVDLPGKPFGTKHLQRLAASADGAWVAATMNNESNAWLVARDVETRSSIVLENEHGELSCISVSPACEYIAAGTIGGAVVVWRFPEQGVPRGRVTAIAHRTLHASTVSMIVVDDEGRISSGAHGGSVMHWQFNPTDSAVSTYRLERHSHAADMTLDAKQAVVGCRDGSLWRVDFASGEQTCLRDISDASSITKVSIAPSGQQFAVGDTAGKVWIGATDQPSDLTVLPIQERGDAQGMEVTKLKFDRSSERLVVGRDRRLVQWWDVSSLQATSAYRVPTGIDAIGMLDEQTALVLGDWLYQIKAPGSPLPYFPQPGVWGATCVCFDARSESFFVGGRDGIVREINGVGRVLKSSRRWPSPPFSSHTSPSITAIAISPDGQNLVSGSSTGDCAIWDAQTLRFLGTVFLSSEPGQVERIRFSGDGNTLMIHQRSSASLTARTQATIRLIRIGE